MDKSISKKTRFEIFKRDQFICQYCGKKPPSIILELDHIIPKSKNGTNDISNLTTSCFDCNRGKSNILLNKICREDISDIKNTLIIKKEQLQEYNKYLKQEEKRIEEDLNDINICIKELRGYGLNNQMKISYKQFLKYFSVYQIKEAIEIAYIKNVSDLVKYSFGILHNWRRRLNNEIYD